MLHKIAYRNAALLVVTVLKCNSYRSLVLLNTAYNILFLRETVQTGLKHSRSLIGIIKYTAAGHGDIYVDTVAIHLTVLTGITGQGKYERNDKNRDSCSYGLSGLSETGLEQRRIHLQRTVMNGHLAEEHAASASAFHHSGRCHRYECNSHKQREYQCGYYGYTYVLTQKLYHGLIGEHKRQKYRNGCKR